MTSRGMDGQKQQQQQQQQQHLQSPTSHQAPSPTPVVRLQTGAQPQSSLGLPTSSVILKFEELLKQVGSLRLESRNIIKRLAEAPGTVPLTKVVTHHLRSIMRTLKRIPELSAELQPYLLPLPSSAEGSDPSNLFGEEPLVLIQGSLAEEAKWRDMMQTRGRTTKRLLEEQLSLKLPFVTEQQPMKRPRHAGNEANFLDVRAALNGDPTQEERLLSVLGRGFSFAMRPLRQDGTLVGVIVIQEGIFQARLLFRAPRCVSGKQKHPEGADHGIPLDSGSEGYIVLEHVVVCGIEESLSSSSTSFVSTHRMFQAITSHAVSASHQLAKRCKRISAPPAAPIRKLLRWLQSFKSVFGDPCRGCKRFLNNDSEHLLFLPPTWRTLDKRVAPGQ